MNRRTPRQSSWIDSDCAATPISDMVGHGGNQSITQECMLLVEDGDPIERLVPTSQMSDSDSANITGTAGHGDYHGRAGVNTLCTPVGEVHKTPEVCEVLRSLERPRFKTCVHHGWPRNKGFPDSSATHDGT